MTINYDIRPFSCYDNYTVASDTENISNVIDKLLRLTTKITESFAGDILYDIRELNQAVEFHREYSRILVFRECGVNSYRINEDGCASLSSYLSGIQVWKLTHDPEHPSTILTRVYLRSEHDIVGM